MSGGLLETHPVLQECITVIVVVVVIIALFKCLFASSCFCYFYSVFSEHIFLPKSSPHFHGIWGVCVSVCFYFECVCTVFVWVCMRVCVKVCVCVSAHTTPYKTSFQPRSSNVVEELLTVFCDIDPTATLADGYHLESLSSSPPSPAALPPI